MQYHAELTLTTQNIANSSAPTNIIQMKLVLYSLSAFKKYETENAYPPLIGGIMANSSLSLTTADSVVYSSLRARTIH